MFRKKQPRTFAAAVGWFINQVRANGFTSAVRSSLFVFAFVALYQFSLFVVQARDLNENLRVLPSIGREWWARNFGADAARGIIPGISDGPVRRAARGIRDRITESGEAEQSSQCEMDDRTSKKLDCRTEDDQIQTGSKPLQNMGAAIKRRRGRGLRILQANSGGDPTPYNEKPVEYDSNGNPFLPE